MNRKFDVLVLAATLLLLGLVALQPSRRLRENAPPEFIYYGPQVSAQNQAADQRIARAYWQCAVKDIQWRYGYAHELPSVPTPEFAISRTEFGTAADDAVLRNHYWNKLQIVWYTEAVWRKQYEWSFRSFREAVDGIADWLHQQVKHFAGN